MNRILIAAAAGAVGAVSSLAALRISRTYRTFNRLRQPAFFYRDLPPAELGVPVFTYHSVAGPQTPDSVTPATFEAHMRYLAENNYHTLTAEALYAYLAHGEPVPDQAVVITFDDGRASLWTEAFPVLERYQLKAVCFLIPNNLQDTGLRAAHTPGEIDLGPVPQLTWEEIRHMHTSGLVDFQSHTLDHSQIHISPKIVDFMRPGLPLSYNQYNLPVLRTNGMDVTGLPEMGTPIYQHRSRLGAARRYFDDEALRAACVAYAAEQGEADFFAQPTWRADMMAFVEDYQATNPVLSEFESDAEQAAAIRHNLAESKRLIEAALPGHEVRHLAYPWHSYSVLAAALARETSYVSAHIAINPQKYTPDIPSPYHVRRDIPPNHYGDDPFLITRIDARDDLLLSLPGQNRRSYRQRVAKRALRLPQWGRWLP